MLDKRVLPWLLTLLTSRAAQRTYQRHCECEYAVDGKCAYTLLLPTTTSGEMVCPVADSSHSLSRLRDDVTALQTWTGEQAKALVTLQNAVGNLTAAVQRLQDAESGGSGTDSRIAAEVDAVREAVDRLNRTVVGLATLCCGDNQLRPSDSNATRPSGSAVLVSKYRLCAVRGLLIDSINDSAITASSVDQSSSTTDVRINSTESDAWCPSDTGRSCRPTAVTARPIRQNISGMENDIGGEGSIQQEA